MRDTRSRRGETEDQSHQIQMRSMLERESPGPGEVQVGPESPDPGEVHVGKRVTRSRRGAGGGQSHQIHVKSRW